MACAAAGGRAPRAAPAAVPRAIPLDVAADAAHDEARNAPVHRCAGARARSGSPLRGGAGRVKAAGARPTRRAPAPTRRCVELLVARLPDADAGHRLGRATGLSILARARERASPAPPTAPNDPSPNRTNTTRRRGRRRRRRGRRRGLRDGDAAGGGHRRDGRPRPRRAGGALYAGRTSRAWRARAWLETRRAGCTGARARAVWRARARARAADERPAARRAGRGRGLPAAAARRRTQPAAALRVLKRRRDKLRPPPSLRSSCGTCPRRAGCRCSRRSRRRAPACGSG